MEGAVSADRGSLPRLRLPQVGIHSESLNSLIGSLGSSLLGGRGGSSTGSDKPCLFLLFEPETITFDVERSAVVKEPIEYGCCRHLLIEDLPPVKKAKG